MSRLKKEIVTVVATVVLLGAIGASRLLGPSPADAEPYHEAVRRAVAAIPMQIGSWSGEDEPLPAAAIDMLQPNVAMHRVYRDLDTGHTASLLLVQCKDARDLAGHFPPICYPGQGWQLDHQAPGDWVCGGTKVEGTEYSFSYGYLGGAKRIIIANFMMLPDGTIARDMEAVRRVASDYKRRFYGAAQVQIVTDARLPSHQRDRVVRDLIQSIEPVLRSVLSGDKL